MNTIDINDFRKLNNNLNLKREIINVKNAVDMIKPISIQLNKELKDILYRLNYEDKILIQKIKNILPDDLKKELNEDVCFIKFPDKKHIHNKYRYLIKFINCSFPFVYDTNKHELICELIDKTNYYYDIAIKYNIEMVDFKNIIHFIDKEIC